MPSIVQLFGQFADEHPAEPAFGQGFKRAGQILPFARWRRAIAESLSRVTNAECQSCAGQIISDPDLPHTGLRICVFDNVVENFGQHDLDRVELIVRQPDIRQV